jgi:hypothetical protein
MIHEKLRAVTRTTSMQYTYAYTSSTISMRYRHMYMDYACTSSTISM